MLSVKRGVSARRLIDILSYFHDRDRPRSYGWGAREWRWVLKDTFKERTFESYRSTGPESYLGGGETEATSPEALT